MELLAIRTEPGRGVYKYETNGEKSRILSKYPGSSTRSFLIGQEIAACEWAGVESLVTEEVNIWAKTKETKLIEPDNTEKINKKSSIIIQETKEVDTTIDIKIDKKTSESETNKEKLNIDETKKETEQIIKHIQTDFEKILEIYKKNGQCYLEITMINGETYCVFVDTYWYLSKDARKYKLNTTTLSRDDLTCNNLRELIYKELITFKETKSGPKNPVFGEIISPDMFAMIPKTKYFAYGDLIYFQDVNFYKYEESIDENGVLSLIARKENIESRKNVSINAKNILKINVASNDTQKIETKEFINLLKKVQKEKRTI